MKCLSYWLRYIYSLVKLVKFLSLCYWMLCFWWIITILVQRFSNWGPRTKGGPRRVPRGSARGFPKIVIVTGTLCRRGKNVCITLWQIIFRIEHTKFYQNHASLVEAIINTFWLFWTRCILLCDGNTRDWSTWRTLLRSIDPTVRKSNMRPPLDRDIDAPLSRHYLANWQLFISK